MSDVPRPLFVLVGPTGSGKTPVSLLLASRLNGEIISADSRQVYRFMDIGTAKPSPSERKAIKHHFVDSLTPGSDFNAGEFGKEGRSIIDAIFRRGKTPIVVGGSGLYIQALIDGFFDGPPAEPAVRRQLYERLKSEGAEALLRELRSVDPAAAAKMLSTNTRRVIRALEVYHVTGTPISQLQQQKQSFDFTPRIAGLDWERKALYRRINARTERMLENGLLDEVRTLQQRGYGETLNALQTVGYKEVLDHFCGKYDYARMVELIKQNTRRYAKRQLTWFRRDKRIHWFAVNDEEDFPSIAGTIATFFVRE